MYNKNSRPSLILSGPMQLWLDRGCSRPMSLDAGWAVWQAKRPNKNPRGQWNFPPKEGGLGFKMKYYDFALIFVVICKWTETPQAIFMWVYIPSWKTSLSESQWWDESVLDTNKWPLLSAKTHPGEATVDIQFPGFLSRSDHPSYTYRTQRFSPFEIDASASAE